MDYSTIEVVSPKGRPASLRYRSGTSDLATIGSTWELWGKLEDEYGLGALPELSGNAIDIGAHIGSITFALLADHPDLTVTAVEPLTDNCEVIEETARANGWTDRLTLLHGGIAKGKTTDIAFNFAGDDYLANHRFIGGMVLGTTVAHQTETVPAYRLSDIIGDGAPFLKVDCEGCEWALLDDPAVSKVERIVGEGHPKDWLKRVHKLLDATHDVEVISDRGGPGTFRAVRK